MMNIRRLYVSIIVTLSIGTAAAPAVSLTADGAALAAQCAARDWGTYMNCQLALLDVRAAGTYCVPELENAARYQYEFLAYMQRDASGMRDVAAETAAAAYFDHAYACPAQSAR